MHRADFKWNFLCTLVRDKSYGTPDSLRLKEVSGLNPNTLNICSSNTDLKSMTPVLTQFYRDTEFHHQYIVFLLSD